MSSLTSNSTQRLTYKAMPHGTVGILANASTTSTQVDYYWATDAQGVPVALFAPANTSQYYWTVNALTRTTDAFFLAMLIVQSPGGLGFTCIGTAGVSVRNGLAPPTAWTYTTSTMPFTNENLNYFVAIQWAPESDGMYVCECE